MEEAPVTSETQGAQEETLLARKVVLATGIEGSGRWAVPPPHPRQPAAAHLLPYARGD